MSSNLDEKSRLQMAWDIAKGMTHLSMNGYIHKVQYISSISTVHSSLRLSEVRMGMETLNILLFEMRMGKWYSFRIANSMYPCEPIPTF